MSSSILSSGSVASHSSESVSGSDAHYLTSEQYNKFLRLINESFTTKDVTINANMACTPLI